jgi:glycosyltransferase involved in cell wall biosynthesis/5-hydroxyisourate hydrolase-like protein (transthyretin family)
MNVGLMIQTRAPAHEIQLSPSPSGSFVIPRRAAGEQVRLSLVLPTYQESRAIGEVIDRLIKALDQITDLTYEIIVADDDSPDHTWEIALAKIPERPNLRVMRRQGERGLATAVLRGWQTARGEILGVMDADLQHPPEIVGKLLQEVDRGADLAVASRYVRGGGLGDWSAARRLISRVAQLIALVVLPEVAGRVTDPMSGYFLTRRGAIAGIEMRPCGYKILLEALARAKPRRIGEVGYTFQERFEGESKICLSVYAQYLRHLFLLRLALFRRWTHMIIPKMTASIAAFLFILSFRSFPAPAQVQQKTAGQGTATVSGRVVLKGEPARNVLVYLRLQKASTRATSETVSQARTDENGRFRINGVAAGVYFVVALAPGFTSPGESSFGPRAKPLNVSEGENVENIEIEIRRGGVITGRGADSQGRPLVDDRVTITRLDKNGKPQPYYPGSSGDMSVIDDRGVYRVYGLAEGRYLVSVGFSRQDGEMRVQTDRSFYPRTFHPSATDQAQAKVIEVTEGSETTGVDITVGELKKTFDVFGRVVNADTGRPAAGVQIFYGAVAGDGRKISGWGSKGEQSNVEGEFQLTGVLPGKYALFAPTDSASDFYSEVTMCEVSDGDVEGVEIKVRQAGTISGVMVIEGANDPAILAKQKNIRLHFDSLSDQLGAQGGDSVPVNPDGSFHIRGLRPGKVELSLGQEAAALGLSRLRVERDGATQPSASVEVSPGERVTNVRFVAGYGAGERKEQ